MLWEQLLQDHDRAPDVDTRIRLSDAARALWPQATAADIAWVARSLEQLTHLDFFSSLFYGLDAAPRSLLAPLLAAAVGAPTEGPQLERNFTEYATKLFGPSDVDEGLLQHVATGGVAEAGRATQILTWWTKPTPAMKDRRQVVYAARLLSETERDLELVLVRLLRFDEAAFAGAERDVVRRAREKAEGHPDEAIRSAAAHQVAFTAVLNRMPAWMRPLWHLTGRSPQQAFPVWPDPVAETLAWVTEALGYPEEKLNYFAVWALRTPPATVWPESLRRALVGAAVDEWDASFNGIFVKPAVDFFGADAIENDMLDRMESGDDDQRVSASQCLYWVRGDRTPETKLRAARVYLTCFIQSSRPVRGALARSMTLDPEANPPALRDLVDQARASVSDDDEKNVRALLKRT